MNASFENIVAAEGCSFRCYEVITENLQNTHDWHFHPEYELVWTRKGSGLRFVGDCVEPYANGDLVLVSTNLPHRWLNTIDDEKPDMNELVILQFNREILGTRFVELPELAMINRLFVSIKQGAEISGETANRIKLIMADMLHQSGFKRLISLLSILELLSTSKELRLLTTPDYDITTGINSTNIRRIETIFDYVRANMNDHINQQDIARKVGLTSQGFSRFFKKYTGQTFIKFVNTLRINEACRLLVKENLDITQVAYMCGFQNISNFNRRFMQFKEQTPSEYRQRYFFRAFKERKKAS